MRHRFFGPLLALQLATSAPAPDPFAFFLPSVALTASDRRTLDRGEALARIVPSEGREVTVFAAVPVNVDGDRLVAWIGRIAALKKSAYVMAIGRFSQPPRLDDLAALTLDEDEASEVMRCRAEDCGLKLTGAEMAALQSTAAGSEGDRRARMQEAFRRVVLSRVTGYLADGDQRTPPSPFAALVAHSTWLTAQMAPLAEYLTGYPRSSMPGVDSFVYWSKERLAGKAIISVTHVSIVRGHDAGQPDALVAAKGIFATHYVNASLALTAIVRGDSGRPNYLVYLNRSDVDAFGGFFGGMVRWVAERRLKGEAALVLQGLRRRLESGLPPSE